MSWETIIGNELEDAIADLRATIGHMEVQAASRLVEIQERAEADKNRCWNDMLDQTRDLRAHLSHFEAGLALRINMTMTGIIIPAKGDDL